MTAADALRPGEGLMVDARGHRCPVPTLRLRRAMEGAADGAVVVLLADDPLARIDLPHFAAEAGHALVSSEAAGGGLRFSLRKGGAAGGGGRGASRDAG